MEEKQLYDVAIWRYFPSIFPDHVAFVSAASPLAAIVQLMEVHGLTKVQHAAAGNVQPAASGQMMLAGPVVAYTVVRLYKRGVFALLDTSWRRASCAVSGPAE